MSTSATEYRQVYDELQKWKRAENEVSAAYLRLRSLIPGAYNTPFAPTPQQVYDVTEEALRRALGK